MKALVVARAVPGGWSAILSKRMQNICKTSAENERGGRHIACGRAFIDPEQFKWAENLVVLVYLTDTRTKTLIE